MTHEDSIVSFTVLFHMKDSAALKIIHKVIQIGQY